MAPLAVRIPEGHSRFPTKDKKMEMEVPHIKGGGRPVACT